MPTTKKQMLFNKIEEHLGFNYDYEMFCEECGEAFSIKTGVPLELVIRMHDAVQNGANNANLDKMIFDYYEKNYSIGLRLCKDCKRKKGYWRYEL